MKIRHFQPNYFLKLLSLILFLQLICFLLPAQSEYSVKNIPDSLLTNSTVVVRSEHYEVNVKKRNLVNIKYSVIKTYLNSSIKEVNLTINYDPESTIKNYSASIYDENGVLIKKVKKSEFNDFNFSNWNEVSDSRVLNFNYPFPKFPITVVFDYEIKTTNTAFLPRWIPIKAYNTAIQNSKFSYQFSEKVNLKKVNKNFENYSIEFSENGIQSSFSLRNIKANSYESFSPALIESVPLLLIFTDQFHLEGVDGNFENWNNFGKWYFNEFLAMSGSISDEVKTEVLKLVESEKEDIDKAKIIYQYVQDKSRYISIQLGIGGWKPTSAMKVHESGYGDCKALTNYTMNLLKVVGIESYYTIINSSASKYDIDKDVLALQGNHVILCLPTISSDTTWLECTSQTLPFGYVHGNIDERIALIIKSEGTKFTKTPAFTSAVNYQNQKFEINVDSIGNSLVEFKRKSSGKFYLNSQLQNLTDKNQREYYSEKFNSLANKNLTSIRFENNKEDIYFTEKVILTGDLFGSILGRELIIPLFPFIEGINIPIKTKNRVQKIEIDRDEKFVDEYVISIPSGYKLEEAPINEQYISSFGNYKVEFTLKNNKLYVKRILENKSGIYSKNDYNKFRHFLKKCAKMDRTKIAFHKN